MRLLYVTRRASPAIGGIESLVRDVAQGVSGEHDVTLVALRIDPGPGSWISDGPELPRPFEPFCDGAVPVAPLRLSRKQRLALTPMRLQVTPVVSRLVSGAGRHALGRLYAQIVAPQLLQAASGVDVVHIWSDGFPAAAALLAARRAGVPAVITPFMHRRAWGDDAVSVAAYRGADRVVALLQPEADEYRALGVASERVVVSGACSRGVTPVGGPALLHRLGITGPLAVFLGGRSDHKGYPLLLEAASLVPAEAGVTIAFVGSGQQLERPAGASGARVIEVGPVDDEERAAWLDAADVLCLLSSSETFGVVILEAWSTGTPVLTSDIPPLRSLVEPSGGGWVVRRDPTAVAVALLDLLRDPERLAAMGAAGRRHWEANFTVERVAAWHADLYRELSAG